MSSTAIVVIVVILLIVAVLGFVATRRRRSSQLQEHFGPEYERSVSAASGDRKAAEAALTERQQRRQEFDVRDLRPEERSRFHDSWNEIQRGFVDDPRQSLHTADRLFAEVMRTRGYPVDDDFDRRADDLSVDHPRVVQHYREARKVHDAGGEVDTENQRTAITSYRSLVEALLGDDDRNDSRSGQHDASGRREAADRDLTDRALTDRDLTDRDGTDRGSTDRDVAEHGSTDPSAAGRHALRDGGSRRDITGPPDTGPTDPNGPQGPRTEERTR